MKHGFFIGLLIILLVNVCSYSVEASTLDSVIILLDPSDPGDTLTVSDVNWPIGFDQQIELVNAGHGEFYVEIFNDPTVWQLVSWLKTQPAAVVLDTGQMNLTLDGGLNVARYQNAVRLLRDKGLSRLALRYLPDRGKESMIKVYYVAYPAASKSSDTAYVIINDSVWVIPEEFPRWTVSLGGEAALLDGKLVMIPTAAIYMARQSYLLSVIGGYLPGDETDKKLLSVSVAYFPGDHKLGLMVGGLYVSETIEAGYLRQGFGLIAGVVLRSDSFKIHLGVGGQRFDDQFQGPSFEPTINLGANFNVLSF
ncbi:MAG: hypothetical protein WCS88_05110 [Patescibacteria group bacterium]|jgi:hypothetical protein